MATPTVLPSRNEIDEVLNWCAEADEAGGSAYPGMSYEQGVAAGLRWLLGEAERPDRD
jgi:hypothetical protein